MDPTDTAVKRGSGNVFVDPGFSDADAHLVKTELVSRIDGIVRQRSITQTEAARLLGRSQPDVSRLLRGDFREYSLERLFRLLNALGRDIDIVVHQPRSADGGRLRIAAAEPVVAGGVLRETAPRCTVGQTPSCQGRGTRRFGRPPAAGCRPPVSRTCAGSQSGSARATTGQSGPAG